MVNLLSQNSTERNLKRYKKRFAVAVLGCLSVLIFAASLIFLPFALSMKESKELYDQEILRIEEYVSTVDTETKQKEAIEAKQMLEAIAETTNTRVYSEIIESIVYALPPSVSLLSFELEENGVGELAGETINRKALVAFADSLRSIEEISIVDVPITNFIEGENAAYQITFYLKKHER
jgi:hypothetical protein